MTAADLKDRTQAFALRVLKPTGSLPDTRSGRVLAGQLGRSGTSVGANYRAACRSRSVAEMISKISIVEEEADELTAMMVASRRTLQVNNRKSRIQNRK
jgi:four helix bundle protein